MKDEFLKAIGKKDESGEAQTDTKRPSFSEYLEEFKKEQGLAHTWAYGTMQCWKTFGNHIEDFNKNATLEYSDEDGITNFIVYLRGTLNMEEKTVQKQYSNLKWFINWAIRKGYTSQDFINRYKPKFKVLEKPVIFLTKEELLKLYRYEIPANEEKVKLTDDNEMSTRSKFTMPAVWLRPEICSASVPLHHFVIRIWPISDGTISKTASCTLLPKRRMTVSPFTSTLFQRNPGQVCR